MSVWRLTSVVEDGLKLRDVLNGNASMAVTSPMFRSPSQGIRVWEFHQVDHLGAHPQPSASVRELFVRSRLVDLQSWFSQAEGKP